MTRARAILACAASIAAVAFLLAALHLAQSSRALDRLRQENEALREQLRQIQALARQSSQPEVDASELERLRQGERELLRLRGEVARLRQQLGLGSGEAEKGTVLKRWCRLNTASKYRPPVEITIIAKTDSTNLRMAYAADQVIFNWELDQWQLRVDGGPADGHHKPGAGHIPTNQFVTIRWVVTPTRQAIYVDGELRFEHEGDYSQINRCVTVFPEVGSTVTVKSISVTQLAGASQAAMPQPAAQRPGAGAAPVPVLKDIPALGELFSNLSNSVPVSGGTNTLEGLAAAMVDADPIAALTHAEQLSPADRRKFLDAAFEAWAGKDTDAALQWVEQEVADPSEQDADIIAIRRAAPVGIGAELRLQDGYAVINRLLPGSPAEQSGELLPGDRIVGVAQGDNAFVDAHSLPLSDLVQYIRGDPGTPIQLQVLPADAPQNSAPITVLLSRGQIKFKR